MGALVKIKDMARRMGLVKATSSGSGVAFSAGGYVMDSVTSRIARLLALNESFRILVNSDSTGDGVGRWPQLLPAALATQYPNAAVYHRQWDDANKRWPDYTVIQSGSGSGGAIYINNGAVTGSQPMYMLGSRFVDYVSVGADLLIINHGYNLNATYWPSVATCIAEYEQLVESVLQCTGPIPVIVVAQSPGNPVVNDLKIGASRRFGSLIGAPVADVGKAFYDAGNLPALYSDALHPSAAGSAIYLAQILSAMSSAAAPDVVPAFSRMGQSLIPNGRFNTGSANSLPAGWTPFNLTVADEVSDFETGRRALSLLATAGAGPAIAQYTLSIAQLNACKGHAITLAVRLKIPEAAPSTAGRIGIVTYGGGGSVSSTPMTTGNAGNGGWRWSLIAIDIPTNATGIVINVYADSASTPTTTAAHAVLMDRLGLFVGRRPAEI